MGFWGRVYKNHSQEVPKIVLVFIQATLLHGESDSVGFRVAGRVLVVRACG